MPQTTIHSGGQSGETTDPIFCRRGKGNHLEPEFCDIYGLRAMFGLRRSLAYQLLAEGAINGVSLRKKGSLRGKRLFNVASVRAFLNSKLEEARK